RKNGLNRLIRGVYGRTIGPDPRNFNQRASLGRNDLLIRTFPRYIVAYSLEKIDVNGRFILVISLACAKLQQGGKMKGGLSLRGDPL
ncbi:hypothetical protein ACEUAZ_09615, partial [Aeromonas veronii]